MGTGEKKNFRSGVEIAMQLEGTPASLSILTTDIEEEMWAHAADVDAVHFIRASRPERVVFDFSAVRRYNWVNAFPVAMVRACRHQGVAVPFVLTGMRDVVTVHLERKQSRSFFKKVDTYNKFSKIRNRNEP